MPGPDEAQGRRFVMKLNGMPVEFVSEVLKEEAHYA
jgi:hypothetical protein